MLDTTPTAFYHTNGGQPARGLFSNIALPSSLPSQLLQNSFVMFPLSGLFGQQQNTEVASTTTTTPTTVAAITAPVSPPCSPPIPNNSSSDNNDNTTNNNNSSNNNNSNNNNKRSSRRSKNQNSTTQVVSSVSATQTGNHHISPRRKKLSNRMNRRLIDQSITLSAIAVEEDQQGNHQCALDLYLNALESMLYAMPIHSDAHRKEAVAEKLHEFIERVGLADRFATPHRDDSLSHSSCPQQTSTLVPDYTSAPPPKDGISSHIISAAVNSAVALKQSPIPDAISATVNYTMKKVKQIDETYRLQEKAWEISRTGINLALEIDQQYNVHEKVGNAIFLTLAAAMKAGIAYKDSPSYQELKRVKAEYQAIGK